MLVDVQLELLIKPSMKNIVGDLFVFLRSAGFRVNLLPWNFEIDSVSIKSVLNRKSALTIIACFLFLIFTEYLDARGFDGRIILIFLS